MTMLTEVQKEFSKLEKQIAKDNQKLDALRMVIKQYATESHPTGKQLNTIIGECINKHGGQATFNQITECMDDHQIMLPKNKLSVLLSTNDNMQYDKDHKIWKLIA